MMDKNLKDICSKLNKELGSSGLVKLTWGNVSIISENGELMYIKPSGVPFDDIDSSCSSVVRLDGGQNLGGLKPSVDAPIHLALYRRSPDIRSIIHTHSSYATAWAQSGCSIPILGTTHADYFPDLIPLVPVPIFSDLKGYEETLGSAVVDSLTKNGLSPIKVGGILLEAHGVLCFSDKFLDIVEKAVVLEEIAKIAFLTLAIKKDINIGANTKDLFSRHYERKNGINKYYGQ